MKNRGTDFSQIDKRVIENIRYLARTYYGGVNSVEKDAGFSAGYLSRVLKKGASLQLKSVLSFAIALGVTVSDLIDKDLYKEHRIAELEKELNELRGGCE